MKRIRRVRAWLLATLLLAASWSGVPLLSAGGHRCPTCPQCDNKVCQPTPVEIKTSKHCWQVECKDICIPAIKWPWQSCCEPPPCGRVKTVKVLKKVEYECQKCGYQWDVKCAACGD